MNDLASRKNFYIKGICFSLSFFFSGLFPSVLTAKNIGDRKNPIVTLNYLRYAQSFQMIDFKKGQKIHLNPGSEFILESGIIQSLDTDKMIDLSSASKMNKKSKVKAFHHHLQLPKAQK